MPAQCPECGRFLKNDLVESLAAGPAPCPACETSLTAEMFDEAAAGRPAADVETTTLEAHAPAAVEAVADDDHDDEEGGHEVAVEAADRDPLDGWDQPAHGPVGSADDHEITVALEPQQALVAGVVGAVLGALVSRRTARGALFGAILAIIAGAVARAVGESRPPR